MIEKWVIFKRDYLEISFLRENCGYDGSDERRVCMNHGFTIKPKHACINHGIKITVKPSIASETYRPLFSHMVWRYKRQYRTKHWHWENLWINYTSERGASELGNFPPFSHSKTAISFNILLVLLILYLRNTYIFRSQITSSYTYNQCSSLLLLMVWRCI